jgi:heme/copper-type cytochrome/quinol oxidase subunit 2
MNMLLAQAATTAAEDPTLWRDGSTLWMPPQSAVNAAPTDSVFYFILWVSVFFFFLIVGLMVYLQ